MKALYKKILPLIVFIIPSIVTLGQVNTTYTSPARLTVPAGMTSILIQAYGGAGGYGGTDAMGNTNAPAGSPGFISASYLVVAGDIIEIFPGGAAANGLNSAAGTGGGAGGIDTYPAGNFDGGKGGNAGTNGSSGGGGGGGAATVVTKNGNIILVAGGASGGGGMANFANSGKDGLNTVSLNGTNNYGGAGVSTGVGKDGGGGGGGGGGQFGSIGGDIYQATVAETAGYGGSRGNNYFANVDALSFDGFSSAFSGTVIIGSLTVLPVSLTSFSSQVNNGQVSLQWSTASEQNSLNFGVERSLNGSTWNNIGVVAASGNSNTTKQYNFTDAAPAAGINYYRLAQKDVDGNVHYSKTVSAEIKAVAESFSIYPNPVVNGSLNITVTANTTIRLYSNTGRKMLEQTLTTGKHIIDVANLAKGTYFIKTTNHSEGFIIK